MGQLSFLRVIVWVGRRMVGGGHSVVEGGEYREVGCGGHGAVEVADTAWLRWWIQRGWDAGHGAVDVADTEWLRVASWGWVRLRWLGRVDCEVCFSV